MPKDSLGIITLGSSDIKKIPRIRSYKIPEENTSVLAYLVDRPMTDSARRRAAITSPRLDSALHVIDSLKQVIGDLKSKPNGKNVDNELDALNNLVADADDDAAGGAGENEGGILYIKNFTGKDKMFSSVTDYGFSKKGNTLWYKALKNPRDSTSKPSIMLHSLPNDKTVTVMKGFNDAKNFAMDESGNQMAFVAERDSSRKSVQQFFLTSFI